MKPLTKDQSQAVHFKAQLLDRYGMRHVNRFEYRDMCATASKSPIVVKQSERVSVRRVTIRGIEILCVYDSFRGTLVTVLPRDITSAEQIYEYTEHRRGEK